MTCRVERVVCGQDCTTVHTYRGTCGFRIPALVSGREAATILGVSRQRVHQLAVQHLLFPVAVAQLASGKLWLRSEIEEFNRVWTRKPGRPVKVE